MSHTVVSVVPFYHTVGLGLLLAALSLAPLASAQEPRQALPQYATEVKEKLKQSYPALDKLYKTLHAQPELSYQEEKTAERLAGEMEALGFEVTRKIGGHGIVCVLKNGPGPTVMVRTDMDALPIVEKTGLDYASKVRIRDAEGKDVGVMHACGHDVHMTCWVGTAQMLASMKDKWSGTLVFIGQPAEERGAGAKAMLEDGLFSKFPKPDFALALHCDSLIAHGTLGYTEGMALANVDSVDIVIKGKGGHGSAPHTTIDPIVIAAKLILDLQTLVSRETNPTDSAVVTVGSIHGGSKHNIISAETKLQLTVRTFKESTRKSILDGIRRKARAAAESAGAPEPEVKVDLAEFTPAMVNDPGFTRRTVAALKKVMGDDNVIAQPAVMGGEDFSRYGMAGVPIFLFRLGTLPPQQIADAKAGGRPLPSLHSDLYYPIPEPSIKTGVLGMTSAVLNLVGK